MKRPTYTPASFIKKVFRSGERSLSRTEITSRLAECLQMASMEVDVDHTLNEILRSPESPVAAGRTDAILEVVYQSNQLNDLAYRYLRESHVPKNTEQIIREIRKHSHFSWNQIERTLKLEQDPRFLQYVGDTRWYLAEWNVVNDDLYVYAYEKNIDRMSLRTLLHIMEQELKLSVKENVFIPELDERFRVDGENVYFTHQASDEVAVATERVAEPQIQTQEEAFDMNLTETKTVGPEVDQLLRQALSLLDTRNQEMANEVIMHFQQSNMTAIEILMKEKHKNEQTANSIQQALATNEQQ